ncbi:LuxR C-terminal-related transcriptional regulator [Nocardia fluminea]|uniref:LuxR C-terminal-related transcriptional regulator n=1 Tax=Nocardia fluminea TaxID=134984 RepID=UPI0037A9EC45
MAKKRVKVPELPDGDRRRFFMAMQRAVVDAGDPSTTALGEQIGYSHQAVYKALTGPRVPSEKITRAICEETHADRDAMLAMLHRAVAEERQAADDEVESRNRIGWKSMQSVYTEVVSTDQVILGAPVFRHAEPPKLSRREAEVLRQWMLTESKADAAKALYISIGTLNTHILRIREKYDAVGRSAPTKAALLARALQDDLLRIDEL